VAGPQQRRLNRCRHCDLAFVPAEYHLSPAQEKERYALHDNSAGDSGYVRYLSGVADALERELPQNGRILDFGSGPDFVLTRILRQRGYCCEPYDPLYGIGAGALRRGNEYAAVIMCEVIEHLRTPAAELEAIGTVVAPDDGIVVIQTRLYSAETEFPSWWYAQDPTHIAFYSFKTMEYIGRLLRGPVEYRADKNLVVVGEKRVN
jgi:hypothetical protein